MQFFPALSRSELVRTVCEQMGWHTPDGIPGLGFGLRVLRELARRGIVRLPAKRGPGRGPQKLLQFDRRTAPQPAVREPLAELAPVRLEPTTEPEDKALWNQWVDRYHPFDFALHAHGNERRAARRHLDTLGPGDLVVYDPGDYSCALLQTHRDRQIEAVFRLQRNANGPVQDFFRSRRCDAVVTAEPIEPTDRSPGRLRLMKYTISDKDYMLGTTLRDAER